MAKLEQEWNDFVESMMETRDKWNAMSEKFQLLGRMDEYALPLQEAVARFGGGEFEIIAPDMIMYARTSGGWEPMLCDLPKKKTTKRKEKTDAG